MSHRLYIFYRTWFHKITLSLSNKFFPLTKFVWWNHRTAAQNQVFAFFVSTNWYKIAKFYLALFQISIKNPRFEISLSFFDVKRQKNFRSHTLSKIKCTYCGQFLSKTISMNKIWTSPCWRRQDIFVTKLQIICHSKVNNCWPLLRILYHKSH